MKLLKKVWKIYRNLISLLLTLFGIDAKQDDDEWEMAHLVAALIGALFIGVPFGYGIFWLITSFFY